MEMNHSEFDLKVRGNFHQILELHRVAPMHSSEEVILRYPLYVILSAFGEGALIDDPEQESVKYIHSIHLVDRLVIFALAFGVDTLENCTEVAELV